MNKRKLLGTTAGTGLGMLGAQGYLSARKRKGLSNTRRRKLISYGLGAGLGGASGYAISSRTKSVNNQPPVTEVKTTIIKPKPAVRTSNTSNKKRGFSSSELDKMIAESFIAAKEDAAAISESIQDINRNRAGIEKHNPGLFDDISSMF